MPSKEIILCGDKPQVMFPSVFFSCAVKKLFHPIADLNIIPTFAPAIEKDEVP